MASFVREVLSAAGTLGDKEDFPDKILKIKKKLHDLKAQLQVHIDSRYSDFSNKVDGASRITASMESLEKDIENIDMNIKKHLKAQIGECNKELLELTDQIQELNLSLQIVNKIKTCYDAIEEGNECVSEGRWSAASLALASSLQLVCSRSCDLPDEDCVKILPALKMEMLRQQQKLSSVMGEKWREGVQFSSQQKDDLVENTFKVDFGVGEGAGAELVQALHLSGLLEDLLVKLCSDLKLHFLEPVLTQSSCSLRISDGAVTIRADRAAGPGGAPDPCLVFSQLRELLSFLSVRLDCPLSGGGPASLLAALSPLLAPWLCDQLVRRVLAPAIPESPEELHTYQEVIERTEEFHEYVVTIGLLAATNHTILNYAKNVDAIFASKVCEKLLTEAREVMKKDLYIAEDVRPEPMLPEEAEAEDLPIPPNFPLPASTFQFPACRVSSSALELLRLATTGLDHAAASKQLCAVRLFHTVRNMFSLWCAVTPTFHREALESLPQVAALAHNSAMLLAHKLGTLGFAYRDRLPGQPTLVDLVPMVREVGTEMLLASMRLQRDRLKQMLTTAGFPGLAMDRRLSSGAEQAVRQVLHTLGHLQKVWQPVLPAGVYLRCLGTLLNTVMEELILIITNLEDISADSGSQLVSLLNQLVTKCPALFAPEDPVRYTKRWSKFGEVIRVLGATLKEIEERWEGGAGPLARELPADQVKQLVRALFQNTERRAGLLAKIK